MHSKISHLSKNEQDLINQAPILISLLISGADGNFDNSEITKAVKIIHIKSYAESRNVRGVYKNIDNQSEELIAALINDLPKETFERTNALIDKLKGLNSIFSKLDHSFAIDLYKSLRELAYYVSQAHSGDLGIGFHNEQEKELAHLEFLNEPKSL